jgi:hypothetical protein
VQAEHLWHGQILSTLDESHGNDPVSDESEAIAAS